MDEVLKAIENTIKAVEPLDEDAMSEARMIQDSLAKPPKSLGRLEDLSLKLAGIAGSIDADFSKKRLLVFAADNGVVSEGVSSAPQSVTAKQALNITLGKSGAGTLSKFYGNEVVVYDVGINADLNASAVINKKIAYGTQNIAKKAAMTRNETERAILTGIEAAAAAKAEGVSVVGIGEMGIGNTTTSAAVLSVLLCCDPAAVTGKGGGITEEAYQRKLGIIKNAVTNFRANPEDPIDVLSKVGGFERTSMEPRQKECPL